MRLESRKTGTAALAAVLLLVSVSQAQPPRQHEISPPEGAPSAESFTSLMVQAMERMHKDMTIVPTGDPDRDFAAMMIPHKSGGHRYGKGPIAVWQELCPAQVCSGVIVEQVQEIEVMQRELRQLSAASKER